MTDKIHQARRVFLQGRPWLVLAALLLAGEGLQIGYAPARAASEMPGGAGKLASADVDLKARVEDVLTAAPEVSTESTNLQVPLQATDTLSHTVFLPYVSGKLWASSSHPYGLQIDAAEPVVLTNLTTAGTHWVRLSLYWGRIEPTNTTPANYRWNPDFEAQLRELAARHFEIILTVMLNPQWAATYPGGPIDLADPSELAEFMNAAVARYSVPPYNVKYWELYNEPDNGDEDYAEAGWGYFGHNPAGYAQALETIYGPVKAANPEAQVVFGGILYDFWVEDGGPFIREFLDGVLGYIQQHPGSYFDVMNFHFYPAFDSRWDPAGAGLIGKTNFLREKLESYGLYKPFICTEIGAQGSAFGNDCCTDETQARYVVQTYARGVAVDLKSIIWFKLIDDPGVDGYWKTGLLDDNLNPKPAFYAYQTVVDQLGSATYVRAMNLGEFNSDWIEGYLYVDPKTSGQILVAWSKDTLDRGLTIPAGQVTVVDKVGNQAVLHDGDDGQVDGSVQIIVGPSPVYLHFTENSQAAGPNGTQDGPSTSGELGESRP